MKLARTLACLSVPFCLLSISLPLDAATKKPTVHHSTSTAGAVGGLVLHAKGKKPVAGAHVRLAGHHARHHHHSTAQKVHLKIGKSATAASRALIHHANHHATHA